MKLEKKNRVIIVVWEPGRGVCICLYVR
jgi:hypothetical protein